MSGSLSDLTLIYSALASCFALPPASMQSCGKADFGHFLYSFSLNRTTIHKLHPCSLPGGQLTLCKSAILPIYRLKRAPKLPHSIAGSD